MSTEVEQNIVVETTSNLEEELLMENMENVINEEMMATEEFAAEVPTAEGAVEAAKPEYFDNEGVAISCSAFCRLKFSEGMSKREIADEFNINYRTVYGATQNMVNDAAPTKRGRSASDAVIYLASNGDVVAHTAAGYLVNGELAADGYDVTECEQVSRNEWIKEQFAAGVSRADLAKILGVSHGVVYNATKDAEGAGSRAKVMITLEDGTEVERTAHIRALLAGGMERKDIAKHLDVAYNVVYQATKVEKSLDEKFATAIEGVEKYAAHIPAENAQMFTDILMALKGIVLVEAVAEEVATEEVVAE